MGAIALAVLLAGCKPENKFQPPPPAEVSVGVPVKQDVAPFEVLTGNTVAFATVDLVARVEGFLTSQNYIDGSEAKKDQQLFGIEQTMYKAKVKEAEAQLDGSKALLAQAEAEFTRQETLLRQNVSAQATFDQAKAKRDNARANVENAEGNLTIAQTNLGYTTVSAPFDGIVSKHLVSVGELVGATNATKLATIVQLDPIYVTFNMSEQDVLQIRQNLKDRRLDVEELSKIPLEIGLMNEEGFPHKGFLNYVSPELDATTGTILVRGLFKNPTRALIPGFFVRVKVPQGLGATASLLVPNRVIGEDQAGKYLLTVNKDNVVVQTRITTGQLLANGLRVIPSGLKPDDQVVLSTNGAAIPGAKVVPKVTTIPVATDGTPAAPK
ncbi:efflux RND transporter periplasmic adaptor subunit [Reyranella sp. MMS21-HV4-11]|uniref:Efflux RND transporter periplasmic adaptor subunit n=1 Tax=Reyranella humidisoli TaxID=2849149 RepID=A0ABS6IGJ6_9HYPH|nr:efflux RND transporter periplasmic adaptor subunit [Reyranella sp. MMS21-HV4-11]MBU8873721.1 efflux RND transporter periplasmic adaptor subunit [Reyranella sp. MMS21-HV4-11]